MRLVSILSLVISLVTGPPAPAMALVPPAYLPVGLFLGSVEEGARIFTPVRFLPFGHPEALEHQFPTLQQLHAGEDELLVHLGRAAGYQLAATLQRYPTQPDSTWPYPDFIAPPADRFRNAAIIHRPRGDAPIPGLRALDILDGTTIGFLVDTRGLSLAERQMEHATTMGLDLTRAQFLDGLARAAAFAPREGSVILVFSE
jgi:hypothetical protein